MIYQVLELYVIDPGGIRYTRFNPNDIRLGLTYANVTLIYNFME